MGQGVLEPVGIVALGEVLAVVGATTLLASQGARHRRRRQVEQIAELDCLKQLGVEALALIG